MLFDTDVLIWYFRGNKKAANALSKDRDKSISIINYMELLAGARNKKEIKAIRSFVKDQNFCILPLSENTGHRGLVYMEEYCLSVGMCLADALIAAAAVENQVKLFTANSKHYKSIKEIELQIFRP